MQDHEAMRQKMAARRDAIESSGLSPSMPKDEVASLSISASAEQKIYWKSVQGAGSSVTPGTEISADQGARSPEQYEVRGPADKAGLFQKVKSGNTPEPELTLKYLNLTVQDRILMLDGCMSTRLAKEKLTEADYRCSINKDSTVNQKDNIAVLSLSKPDLILDIHKEYMQSGSDIIRTLTADASAISLGKYMMQNHVYEVNKAAAQVAKQAAAVITAADLKKTRLVAGVLGPTSCNLAQAPTSAEDVSRHASSRKHTAFVGHSHAPECKQYGTTSDRFGSISPDGPLKGKYFCARAWREWQNWPSAQWPEDGVFENVSFDELVEAYIEQICGLVDGGVDMIMMQGFPDTLNAKAAVYALESYYEQFKKKPLPLLISACLLSSGRMGMGQNIEAFCISMKHAKPLAFGISGSLPTKEATPFYKELARVVPNWGLFCPAAGRDEPAKFAKDCLEIAGDLNFIGGGDGVLPSHIAELAKKLDKASGRKLSTQARQLRLSGTDPYVVSDKLTIVGQRGNLRGCEQFRELVYGCAFNSAVGVLADQVRHGADILDVNLDSSWDTFDVDSAMCTLLSWCALDPTVARVPLQVGSSKWPTVINALKHIQGKPIVSAIGLSMGEDKFIMAAEQVRQLGAALIIRVEDNDTEKVRIGKLSYKLLRSKLDFPPEDIIFDCNLQTVGIPGLKAARAATFLSAVEDLKRSCPYASFIGGLSNLSLQYRYVPYLRQAMHSVFLQLAIPRGLNMAICCPGDLPRFADVDGDTVKSCEEMILNESRSGDHVERFSVLAASMAGMEPVPPPTSETQIVASAPLPPVRFEAQPLKPITTIVQSAGAITWNAFIIMGTKAGACHNIHRMANAMDVSRSVVFSSISVWMGMGGSAISPAASSLLDTYSMWLNWQMMDASSSTVQWGPIGDIGVRRLAYGSRDVFAQYDMGQKLVSAEDAAACERALCTIHPPDFLAVAYVDDPTKVLWEGKVQVKMRDQECEMSFKIKADTPLSRLEDVYLKQKNQKNLDVQLTYRGKPISETDTAKSLNLAPADVIDVIAF